MKSVPIFKPVRGGQSRARCFTAWGLDPWARATAVLVLLVALGFAVAGCKGSGEGGAGSKAFESAAPEAKAAWDGAVAASRSNDYAAAFLTLRELRAQPGLTPAQTQAVEAQSTLINQRMAAAAEKGDSNALQAIRDIRAVSRRGRP